MKNIKLIIEYDGTNYYGWQKQNDKVTIQGTLEEAVRNLTKEENEIHWDAPELILEYMPECLWQHLRQRVQYHPISLESN